MKKLLFLCTLLMISALYVSQATAQKQPHKEYSGMKISECNDCHKSEGAQVNHDSDWIRFHRKAASKPEKNCAECHDQSFCLDCHQGGGINQDFTVNTFTRDYIPKSHRSDFVQIHPLKALDNPQNCYRCHDQRFCSDCHNRFPRGSFRVRSHMPTGPNSQMYVWTNEHSREAKRNLQFCQSCHPQGDVCLRCHSAKIGAARINPHPKDFQGGNISSRTNRTCRNCH